LAQDSSFLLERVSCQPKRSQSVAMKSAVVIALVGATSSSAAVLGNGKAFLGNGMQPEVVARTLSSVEDEWKAQAAVFAECDSTSGGGSSIVNCADAPSSFGKSCATVVGAIIQGSGGDKDVAKEYMVDVCSQKAISGWHQAQCHALSLSVQGSMSADKYENRQHFNTGKLCTGFWSRFLSEEQKRMAQEKAEHEVAEKKEAEEQAAAEKKAAEEAKIEAERKKTEDAARAKKDAETKAAEEAAQSKAKVAEAAARSAQKKLEAEESAQAAKLKMEEAKTAEEEHAKTVAAVKAPEAAPKVEKKVTKEEVVFAKPIVAVAKAPAATEPVAKAVVAKTVAAKEAPKPAAPAAPKTAAKPAAVPKVVAAAPKKAF